MNKKYLVKVRTSHQITEDTFKVYYEEKLFDKTATIEDIEAWYKKRFPYKESRLDVRLTQPEQ
jgi:hypothetical protein